MEIGAWRPFYLVKRVTLDASGNGTVVLSVGSNEQFVGESVDFIVSSGTFNILQIKDSAGNGYTDSNNSNPLPSAYFLTTLEQRTRNQVFAELLVIPPSGQLTFEFSGGTASATIDVVIKGKKMPHAG